MNHQRSFSAPYAVYRGVPLQNLTSAQPPRSRAPERRWSPRQNFTLPAAYTEGRVAGLDRYPLLPPLGQAGGEEVIETTQEQRTSAERRKEQPPAVRPRRPLPPPPSTRRQPNPPPPQAPTLLQTFIPGGYPQPLPFPPTLYPPMPYAPLPPYLPPYPPYGMPFASPPLPYLPYTVTSQDPRTYHTMIPQTTLPQITELIPPSHSSEYLERGRDHLSHSRWLEAQYDDHLSQSSLCREVCEELVASCVSDTVREVVNGCFDDIIRSYLARSQLLTGAHRTSPMVASNKASSKAVKATKTVNVRPRSNPVCAQGPTRLQPLEAGGEQRREEEEGSMLKRKEWWNQRRQGRHNRLLQMETKAEISHQMCSMLLDELLLCQLLETLLEGGQSMAIRMHTQHMLNGLLFEGLLEELCRHTP